MLTDLPVELLSTIASSISSSDLFNLRLTSRKLCAGLADDFGRRFFHHRMHFYTIRDLKKLFQISQVPRLRNAIKQLDIVVTDPRYRDLNALRPYIVARATREHLKAPQPEPLSHDQSMQGRTHDPQRNSGFPSPLRTASRSPPPSTEHLSSDRLALQDSANDQCANLFSYAMTELVQAHKPARLSFRYQRTDRTIRGLDPEVRMKLDRLILDDARQPDPADVLAPVPSLASKVDCSIVALDLGSVWDEHCYGLKELEPLTQVPPSALAGVRRLSISPTLTTLDLESRHRKVFQYLLSLLTSLADLKIDFRRGHHYFFNTARMAVLTD
jgi:hypothetical protein